jgi:hypothetical protein
VQPNVAAGYSLLASPAAPVRCHSAFIQLCIFFQKEKKNPNGEGVVHASGKLQVAPGAQSTCRARVPPRPKGTSSPATSTTTAARSPTHKRIRAACVPCVCQLAIIGFSPHPRMECRRLHLATTGHGRGSRRADDHGAYRLLAIVINHKIYIVSAGSERDRVASPAGSCFACQDDPVPNCWLGWVSCRRVLVSESANIFSPHLVGLFLYQPSPNFGS